MFDQSHRYACAQPATAARGPHIPPDVVLRPWVAEAIRRLVTCVASWRSSRTFPERLLG